MRSLLAMLAAVNPAAVALALWPRERGPIAAAAAAITWALVLVGAAVSEPLLDALDVSAATFRIAAGVVVGLAGARWLVFGASPVDVDTPVGTWRRLGVPLLIPVLVTPQLAMVAISTGADDGTLGAAWTAALVLALAWIAAVVMKRRRLPWLVTVRFLGALGILVAFALVVDGVKSV
jgi:small neutral amino acid transporter SnatA (MarC family)